MNIPFPSEVHSNIGGTFKHQSKKVVSTICSSVIFESIWYCDLITLPYMNAERRPMVTGVSLFEVSDAPMNMSDYTLPSLIHISKLHKNWPEQIS